MPPTCQSGDPPAIQRNVSTECHLLELVYRGSCPHDTAIGSVVGVDGKLICLW